MYLPYLSHFFFFVYVCPSSFFFFCYCTSGIDMSNFHSTTLLKKMLVSWSSHRMVRGLWAYFVPFYLVHANDSSNKRITTQEKNTSYYNNNISLSS